jgi:hypothetical protein
MFLLLLFMLLTDTNSPAFALVKSGSNSETAYSATQDEHECELSPAILDTHFPSLCHRTSCLWIAIDKCLKAWC